MVPSKPDCDPARRYTQKEAAELTVEAEAKKVLYFETLNRVYTAENLVVYPGFRTKEN